MTSREPRDSFVVASETVWPRTMKERYGIFRVKDGGRPELMATCRTRGEIGAAIYKLGSEGEFDDYMLGVMDGRDHQDKNEQWVGKWIVTPWLSKQAIAQLKGK